MLKNKLLSFTLLFSFYQTLAQTELPVPANIRHAYSKGTRDNSGAPGKNYWQNKADYELKASFDPVTRKLNGRVGIDYVNNSPDTLTKVLFKLYPNLYQRQAMRTMPIAPSDLTNGVKMTAISMNEQAIDSTRLVIRSTNMTLRGTKVLPGQHVHFDIDYSYTLNEHSFIRTGQVDTGAFFIAYFFPRITVYDDLDGWNEYPYTGHDEFYNDYGNFKAEITVPGNYQVWATGDLKNTNEIYTPGIASRIKKAESSGNVTNIITEADIRGGTITKRNKTNTWHFEAANVTDFAFSISNHYVWKATSLIVDATSGRRTRADAVFNPRHPAYLPVINYARKTIILIDNYLPGRAFPYPHITVFDGLDAMEYPMMVNDLPFENPADAIEFTSHEIFHSLFPFFVGTNETKYAFMDEGWGTMAEFTLHPLIDSAVAVGNNVTDVNRSAGTEQDAPIMTLTPQLAGNARYADKDMKPALGYYYLREMLGNKLFNKALNNYIDRWKGKHPMPFDFFNSFNISAGTNLNWFWQNWFFNKFVPDLAIAGVVRTGDKYRVSIKNIGGGMVPVHLTILYVDGSKQILSKTIACWAKGDKTVTLNFRTKKQIREIVLGTAFDADADHSNNIWKP